MENSLLINLLQQFRPTETAMLRKFLQSPYHNSRADVLALFEYLVTQKPTQVDSLSDRQVVFQSVYGAKKYDSKQLNYVVSYLIKLIESFVAQEEYALLEQEQRLYTVRGFRRRHWLPWSERASRTAVRRLEKQDQRNAEYYRQYFHLAYETMRGQMQQGRSLEFDSNSLNEAHEKAFFIEKLQLGCMTQSLQTVASKAYDKGFLPVLLTFLQDHPWLQEPALAAWYHGFYIQTDATATSHFESLKTVMFRHGLLFSNHERQDLFLLAVNFCIRRINSGDTSFSKDLFELYREGLQQHVFLDSGVISRWSYNNIVNAALKMGEIEWSMQFLEDYRAKLEPAFRDTNYYFNLARCLYEKGALGDALESLTRMEYDDILQNLSAKTLQVKIYYDLQSWQSLDSLLDSVSIYIRRKKVLGYHKENYTNILRFMQRLMALPQGNREARHVLKQELESCKVLSERGWFLSKLAL